MKSEAMFPNLFIVGTPKAGTTSLHDNLSLLDCVQAPSEKEPHFFSDIGNNVPSVYSYSQSQYVSMYDFHDPMIRYWLDSSVSYLHQPSALKLIRESVPDPKVIIMLREPVDRMYSHWLMDFREGVNNAPFREAVLADIDAKPKGFGFSHMYLECSQYYEYVAECYNIFGTENVFVGFFEDYIRDGVGFMDEILSWLEILHGWGERSLNRSNPAAIPKNDVYAFFLHNFIIRRYLKKLVHPAVKSSVRRFMLKSADKLSISESDRMFFSGFFDDDIVNLSSIVDWDYRKWHREI